MGVRRRIGAGSIFREFKVATPIVSLEGGCTKRIQSEIVHIYHVSEPTQVVQNPNPNPGGS
jgi:hypothetical protein